MSYITREPDNIGLSSMHGDECLKRVLSTGRRAMQAILFTLVVAVVVVSSAGTSAPAAAATEGNFSVSLDEAFADRAAVEAVVACFIDTSKCDAEQEKIRG